MYMMYIIMSVISVVSWVNSWHHKNIWTYTSSQSLEISGLLFFNLKLSCLKI